MTNKTRILACVLALTGFAAAVHADELSTSVMRPTPVNPATGLVAGNLPGGQGAKSYYVTVDLQPGDLITQLQVAGTPNTGKKVEFELLNESARMVASVYAMANLDAKGRGHQDLSDRPRRPLRDAAQRGRQGERNLLRADGRNGAADRESAWLPGVCSCAGRERAGAVAVGD